MSVARMNEDIRKAIRVNDLTSYQVAARLQMSQSGFFYRLQSPLTEDQKAEIMTAIEELAREKAGM